MHIYMTYLELFYFLVKTNDAITTSMIPKFGWRLIR